MALNQQCPLLKLNNLSPDLVIIKPRMEHYIKISRQIRLIMDDATPAVEPVSIDEAFLDLSGTEKLHKCIPAISMLKIQKSTLTLHNCFCRVVL